MRKLLLLSLLAGLVSCGSDPVQTKAQFPSAVAQAICQYYWTCCADPTQRAVKITAASQADCVTQVATQYAAMYQSADEKIWDGKAAQACVDKVLLASTAPVGNTPSTTYCQRGYDPNAAVLGCTPPPILPTKTGGDSCMYSWQCKTQFCRGATTTAQGTCHNPLVGGDTCQPTEPVAAGSACVQGLVVAQKPDNSSCTYSEECISASCGGGKCVASTRFTCDGQP
jgi:hypothetical protein